MSEQIHDPIPSDPGAENCEALPPPPTRGAVKSGVIWVGAGFGLKQILRFGSSIVLASLLYPEAFGLYALTFAFITGLHLFSDLGIRVSIIQNPRGDDPDFLNTAWTIQIIRGFVLFIAAALFAWPAAYWRPNPEPDLLWLLPLVSVASIFDGFTSTKLHSLHRHLAQKKAAMIDFFSTAAGIAVQLTWAYFDHSVISLASGSLSGVLVEVILGHLLPGPRNRLKWDPASARQIVHFGRWIFLSTIFTFMADHMDRIVVSFFSVTILGVYHIANQFAMVPAILMGTLARQLVLPLYSRMNDAGKNLDESVRMVQLRAGALAALLIAGLIAVGPTLIRCLYDDRYQEAGWILPMLAVSALFQIFVANASSLLIARGNSRIYALSNAIKVGCLIVFMPLGAYFDGLRGLIAALIAGDMGRYLCAGTAASKYGSPIFRRDAIWAIIALVVGVSVNQFVDAVGLTLPNGRKDWPRLIERLALEAAGVIVCWGVAAGAVWEYARLRRKSAN